MKIHIMGIGKGDKGEREDPQSAKTLDQGMSCCRVEAMVAIDERGQMVLPKDLREKAGVKAGDRFVVISGGSEDKVCCILMVKAEDFSQTAKQLLGPMMKEILQ